MDDHHRPSLRRRPVQNSAYRPPSLTCIPSSKDRFRGRTACVAFRPALGPRRPGTSTALRRPASTMMARTGKVTRLMPRSDGQQDPPDDMTSRVPSTPTGGMGTRDAGAVQLLIFLGWIPTGLTAIISGLFV